MKSFNSGTSEWKTGSSKGAMSMDLIIIRGAAQGSRDAKQGPCRRMATPNNSVPSLGVGYFYYSLRLSIFLSLLFTVQVLLPRCFFVRVLRFNFRMRCKS